MNRYKVSMWDEGKRVLAIVLYISAPSAFSAMGKVIAEYSINPMNYDYTETKRVG